MRQFIYLLSVCLSLLLGLGSPISAQNLIQGTLKPGATADQVEVWLKPNFDNAGLTGDPYLFQIGLPIAFPASASPQPASLTVSLDPGFVTNFGSNYSVTVNAVATATGGTEKYFNIVLLRGGAGASDPQDWTAGTEFKVLTATFHYAAGSTTFLPKLADYQDGGSDGQGNFYTQSGGGAYYISSTSTDNFYAVPSVSVVGGTATAGYAQLAAPADNAGTVTGTTPLCVSATATYTSDGDAGGTWSSTNTGVATVNPTTGLVTAVAAGSTDITYTVGSASAFQALTVNAAPTVNPITGTLSVVVGNTTQLASTTGGGTWSSGATGVATVNSSGLVTGVAAGIATISYAVTGPCGTTTVTSDVTVSDPLIQGTVKPGATVNQVEIWLRPNFTNSTEYLFQIGLPIVFPTSASPAPTGFTVTMDPAFETSFGDNYSVTINPVATATGGTESYFNIVLLRGGDGASDPQSWTQNTEFRVLTLTWTYISGTTSFLTKLADYADGGGDGQANFYTQSGTGTYYRLENSVGNFYSASAQTNVGGNNAAGYAQLDATVLPVQWLELSGRSAGGQHIVSWTTAQEQANKGFSIERSANGLDFSAVGFVASKGVNGNSGTVLRYQFEETALAGGPYYYRLRQQDLDGRTTLSPVVVISNTQTFSLGALSPNPATGLSYLKCQSPIADELQLVITDVQGRVLLQRKQAIGAGETKLSLDLSAFSRGQYLLRVTSQQQATPWVQSVLKL